MGKTKTRRKKVPSQLRLVIAANVAGRAKHLFPKHPNLPMAIREASAEAESERIAKSHVQNIIAAKVSVTLEQLEVLARALELSAYQLLIQDLDPTNPQVVKGATADERALYRRIAQEAVKEALQQTNPGYKPTKQK